MEWQATKNVAEKLEDKRKRSALFEAKSYLKASEHADPKNRKTHTEAVISLVEKQIQLSEDNFSLILANAKRCQERKRKAHMWTIIAILLFILLMYISLLLGVIIGSSICSNRHLPQALTYLPGISQSCCEVPDSY